MVGNDQPFGDPGHGPDGRQPVLHGHFVQSQGDNGAIVRMLHRVFQAGGIAVDKLHVRGFASFFQKFPETKHPGGHIHAGYFFAFRRQLQGQPACAAADVQNRASFRNQSGYHSSASAFQWIVKDSVQNPVKPLGPIHFVHFPLLVNGLPDDSGFVMASRGGQGRRPRLFFLVPGC